MADQLASPSTPETMSARRRFALFGLVLGATIAGVVAYAVVAEQRREALHTLAHPVETVIDDQRLAALRREPHLLFRNAAPGPLRGRLAVVPLDAPSGTRVLVPLVGERVYATGDAGFLLAAPVSTRARFEAVSFDPAFLTLHKFTLAGVPSRTRVSSDGRYAAATAFVTGDSYDPGGFSSRTSLLDLADGKYLGDLEEFRIVQDGSVLTKPDANFWGVTFAADSDRFYATLSTEDVPYLIEGSVSRREATVIRRGVECPSLSRDGTRIAFKSRQRERSAEGWSLAVWNIRANTEVVVAETRSVDDQAEWFDDATLLYALPRGEGEPGVTDLWTVPADGSGRPALLVRDASSPCVLRP